MTPLELASAWAAITFGCAVQGSIGFGLGPIATPLLFLIDPNLVTGPVLFASLTLSVLVVRREREAIHFTGIAWGLAGRLPGTILGAAAVVLLATVPVVGLNVGTANPGARALYDGLGFLPVVTYEEAELRRVH